LPEQRDRKAKSNTVEAEASPPTPEDFYWDGPYVVFTAAYHRNRGFCCGNGCRHCPYDEAGKPVLGKGEL